MVTKRIQETENKDYVLTGVTFSAIVLAFQPFNELKEYSIAFSAENCNFLLY